MVLAALPKWNDVIPLVAARVIPSFSHSTHKGLCCMSRALRCCKRATSDALHF